MVLYFNMYGENFLINVNIILKIKGSILINKITPTDQVARTFTFSNTI